MSSPENPQSVVVTDIRMPFWSMVVFMVKWAIAAIPALILLAVFAFLVALVFTGTMTALSSKASFGSIPEIASPTLTPTTPKALEYTGPLADRCKGSYEPEKCMEAERKLTQETPEQRLQRQRELEKQRRESLEKVGK